MITQLERSSHKANKKIKKERLK